MEIYYIYIYKRHKHTHTHIHIEENVNFLIHCIVLKVITCHILHYRNICISFWQIGQISRKDNKKTIQIKTKRKKDEERRRKSLEQKTGNQWLFSNIVKIEETFIQNLLINYLFMDRRRDHFFLS